MVGGDAHYDRLVRNGYRTECRSLVSSAFDSRRPQCRQNPQMDEMDDHHQRYRSTCTDDRLDLRLQWERPGCGIRESLSSLREDSDGRILVRTYSSHPTPMSYCYIISCKAIYADRLYSLQELLLSSIYILHTLRILRSSQAISSTSAATARKILWQLFTINVLIIAMDVLLLGFEFANLYIMEASFKGVVYSVKLKLEFAVLGKLVLLVKRERSASAAALNGSGAFRGRQYSLAVESEKKGKSEIELKHNGAAQGIGKAVSGGLQTVPLRVPPPVPPVPAMRADSAHSTEISAVDSMELPQRAMTPKSVKGNREDAMFEHYEKLLDM